MNYESIDIGTEVASREIDDIRGEEIKLGVGVLRDQNPIHFDEYAAAKENRELVNLGPISMAYVMQVVLSFAERPERIERYDIRFEANVFAGDTVSATAVVADKHRDGDEYVFELDIALERPDGTTPISGTATVRVPA